MSFIPNIDFIVPLNQNNIKLPEYYNYEFTEKTFHENVDNITLNDEYNQILKFLPKKLLHLSLGKNFDKEINLKELKELKAITISSLNKLTLNFDNISNNFEELQLFGNCQIINTDKKKINFIQIGASYEGSLENLFSENLFINLNFIKINDLKNYENNFNNIILYTYYLNTFIKLNENEIKIISKISKPKFIKFENKRITSDKVYSTQIKGNKPKNSKKEIEELKIEIENLKNQNEHLKNYNEILEEKYKGNLEKQKLILNEIDILNERINELILKTKTFNLN